MVDVVPAPHHLKTGKQVNILTLGDASDQFDHARSFWFHDHLWRELRINQHDIGAGRADLGDALANRNVLAIETIVADYRIGAELPYDQVGLSCDHVCIKALEHIANVFAPHAAVKHGDRMARETLYQLDRKPARIGGCRRTSTSSSS